MTESPMTDNVMMNLPDDLPQIVVMCGISGSGKTTLSRVLEARGYYRISSDRIAWERYGNTLSCRPAAEQREIFACIFSEMMEELKMRAAQGERVVVDNAMCKRAQRERVREICREAGAEMRLLYLDVPYDVLAERLRGRTGSGPDDQIIPLENLRSFCANFEPPSDLE